MYIHIPWTEQKWQIQSTGPVKQLSVGFITVTMYEAFESEELFLPVAY